MRIAHVAFELTLEGDPAVARLYRGENHGKLTIAVD